MDIRSSVTKNQRPSGHEVALRRVLICDLMRFFSGSYRQMHSGWAPLVPACTKRKGEIRIRCSKCSKDRRCGIIPGAKRASCASCDVRARCHGRMLNMALRQCLKPYLCEHVDVSMCFHEADWLNRWRRVIGGHPKTPFASFCDDVNILIYIFVISSIINRYYIYDYYTIIINRLCYMTTEMKVVFPIKQVVFNASKLFSTQASCFQRKLFS